MKDFKLFMMIVQAESIIRDIKNDRECAAAVIGYAPEMWKKYIDAIHYYLASDWSISDIAKDYVIWQYTSKVPEWAKWQDGEY